MRGLQQVRAGPGGHDSVRWVVTSQSSIVFDEDSWTVLVFVLKKLFVVGDILYPNHDLFLNSRRTSASRTDQYNHNLCCYPDDQYKPIIGGSCDV